MRKAKPVEPDNLETKLRDLLRYEHSVTVDSECEFGDHWYCSCGKSDLDSPAGHLADMIIELIHKESKDV